MCSVLCAEDLCTIKPFADSDVVLAPTNEMQSEMYSTLIRNGVITISPESNLDAFVDDDTFPITYKVYRVEYQLNLAYPDDKQTLFDAILRPSYYTDDQKDDALCMWRQIATGECIEYLMYQLKQVGFLGSNGSKFEPGQKTLKVFGLLLDHYSVAQIYYIIWKAVTETSRLYLEKGLSKRHAANAVITACERIGDRARLNGWNIPQYNRIRDLPQSALSSYYFDRVLGIGDLGFTLPPQTNVLDIKLKP
jgi:hypothetical protein